MKLMTRFSNTDEEDNISRSISLLLSFMEADDLQTTGLLSALTLNKQSNVKLVRGTKSKDDVGSVKNALKAIKDMVLIDHTWFEILKVGNNNYSLNIDFTC